MEILLIVVIVLGIFLLPRLMARKSERDLQPRDQGFRFTGRLRFAIVVSFLWMAIVAFFLEPWAGNRALYFYVAAGPVLLLWGLYWVFSGFRKERGRSNGPGSGPGRPSGNQKE